jgi:hypothetical protein
MKRQRIYPIVVRWGKTRPGHTAGAAGNTSLVLRPVIPGAQVVPAELSMESSQPTGVATFYVTPAALGRLSKAHLEVLKDGRKVERIGLGMIVIRQLVAWVLLALAILVPTLLILTTRDNKLAATEPKVRKATEEEKERAKSRAAPLPGAKGQPIGARLGQKDDDPKEGDPGDANNNEVMTIKYYPKPGEILEDRLNHYLPPIVLGEGQHAFGLTEHVVWGLSKGYQFTCDTMDELPQIPLYIAGGLLVLALLSWFLHTPAACTTTRQIGASRA